MKKVLNNLIKKAFIIDALGIIMCSRWNAEHRKNIGRYL